MRTWNDHSDIKKYDKHAILSASKSSWIDKDDDQVLITWARGYSQVLGTAMHELAEYHIRYRYKVNKSLQNEIRLQLISRYHIPEAAIDIGFEWELLYENWMVYVNDGISYRLDPEVPLKYSEIAFGTADTVTPLNTIAKTNKIRIHDYKSGISPVHISQLLTYDALLCLEYDLRPGDYEHTLCFYQLKKNDDDILVPTITTYNPTIDEIAHVMDEAKYKSDLISRRILGEE